MIEFQTEEVKDFALFYAHKMTNKKALEIISKLEVTNSDEATEISNFFWDLIDKAAIEQDPNIIGRWDHGQEFLSEKLMYAISGYLEKAGYETEWDQVSDTRNES